MRLIDADALVEHCNEIAQEEWNKRASPVSWADAYENFADDVDAEPTIDAAPAVHGRWLESCDGWYFYYSCSECGAEALTKEETMHDQVCSAYCPNCGAKMDAKEDANDG